MSSSVGVIIPNVWENMENKNHVPNHQPDEQLPGALIAEEILPQGTFHQFQLQLCLGVRRPAVQA